MLQQCAGNAMPLDHQHSFVKRTLRVPANNHHHRHHGAGIVASPLPSILRAEPVDHSCAQACPQLPPPPHKHQENR